MAKKYVIIKGKAYPIGKKKPKFSRPRPRSSGGGFFGGINETNFGPQGSRSSEQQMPIDQRIDQLYQGGKASYMKGKAMYKGAKEGPLGQYIGKKIREYKAPRKQREEYFKEQRESSFTENFGAKQKPFSMKDYFG